MSRIGNFMPVSGAAPIGASKEKGTQAFVARWGEQSGSCGRAATMIISTAAPALKNVRAKVTVFQIIRNVETPVGLPVDVVLSGGAFQGRWNVPFAQENRNYHFKVTTEVQGNSYFGKTGAPLAVMIDGFDRR